VRIALGETPALDAAEFDRAVRRQIRTNLSSLASPMHTTHRWDDLILNDEQREVLDEILAHAKHRQLVFEEWGFGRKIGGRGKGLSCLFSGAPGTGKTMSATLIAGELGLDLYQVDLSRIVDKYVGETEKNLARLFDEASRVPVVLLFDEADSLFATRTKVESSNDRYANLEVNFLLQKMEQHDGICVLTTNLGTGIDEAFKRRLRFRLHFDMPGPEQREKLWRQMVPQGVKVADDVQWEKLARRWEMSGAIIKNAVLRSAFLAAARDQPLTMELLTRAARAELMEMGRLG
jgi:SpoVK/Ycf46/Vps4 family AAA+-type ATPase